MAVFGWVPFTDSSWQVQLLTTTIAGSRCNCLPMFDGSPPMGGGPMGNWADIAANDILLIAAHGRRYTTDSIAWVGGDRVITVWGYTELAQQIWLRLGAQRSSLSIDYRLLACFGANNITPLATSFGSKLAKAMRGLNMHGTLTAYKGATGMGKLKGHQVGSSRTTCALSIIRHGGMTKGRATDQSAKVWNL